MAKVFQIVSVGKKGGHQTLVDDAWHVATEYPTPSTFCGITLEGDDDIEAGPTKEGRVTCRVCRGVLESGRKNQKLALMRQYRKGLAMKLTARIKERNSPVAKLVRRFSSGRPVMIIDPMGDAVKLSMVMKAARKAGRLQDFIHVGASRK